MADEDRQRDRGSRLCGCKFRIKLVESINGSFFLVHDLSVEHAKHNHELSTIPSVHPSLRKLENEAKASIERQIAVGSTPKQILALQLHDQSSGQAPPTPRDIYNLGAIAKRKASHCLEPPEALLAHLRDNNYEVATRSEYVTGATQRLLGILFSHPDAIALTKRYPVAITIDATYKTNKYGMPLVHIIGLTATGNTFCSAVALVTREREVDYLWVLDEYNKIRMCTELPGISGFRGGAPKQFRGFFRHSEFRIHYFSVMRIAPGSGKKASSLLLQFRLRQN
ncbi:hypothetical protein A4X09_0g7308 [Tilletia walkeri]|uniref:MULE transposase domain-containing protein n=1 Tax=Tilletia walkeri TaxID=117179 RepID=A0A8X7N251_9BASI|nr:hypothetical protein A4X09_0g7308 [Tilletia walkeri]